MSDTIETSVSSREYKKWERATAFNDSVTEVLGTTGDADISREIAAPPDVVYRLLAADIFPDLMPLLGETLIEADLFPHIDPNGDASIERVPAIVAGEPLLARICASREHLEPGEDEEYEWSVSCGVHFEFESESVIKGFLQVGIAMMSDGQRGVYVVRGMSLPDGSMIVKQTDGLNLVADEFDAFIANVRTLNKMASASVAVQ